MQVRNIYPLFHLKVKRVKRVHSSNKTRHTVGLPQFIYKANALNIVKYVNKKILKHTNKIQIFSSRDISKNRSKTTINMQGKNISIVLKYPTEQVGFNFKRIFFFHPSLFYNATSPM